MSLDSENTEVAYCLDRLFATIEKTQRDAQGKVGASVRDRFYSSASTTPRSVFPHLLKAYQHHVTKLTEGQRINYEKLVQQIMSNIQEFPAHLGMAEQGLYTIGYYHQMQAFYTKKTEADRKETP